MTDVQPGLGPCALGLLFIVYRVMYHCRISLLFMVLRTHMIESAYFFSALTRVPTCPYFILLRKESKGVGRGRVGGISVYKLGIAVCVCFLNAVWGRHRRISGACWLPA